MITCEPSNMFATCHCGAKVWPYPASLYIECADCKEKTIKQIIARLEEEKRKK